MESIIASARKRRVKHWRLSLSPREAHHIHKTSNSLARYKCKSFRVCKLYNQDKRRRNEAKEKHTRTELRSNDCMGTPAQCKPFSSLCFNDVVRA